MLLTRHRMAAGSGWALDGDALARGATLGMLLQLPSFRLHGALQALESGEPAEGALLPPLDEDHEVWASGVTYMRSREARMAESDARDVYDRVYDAERPELFFKAGGRRVAGQDASVRIRADSRWNVPEPELVVVANRAGEIVGYTAGNDMSSRDIEGANPLYLPQAKVYDGACAIGPGIVLCSADEMRDLPVTLTITRSGGTVFEGETSASRMRRSLDELVSWLYRELEFPIGALLMTGTGVVPSEDFTLVSGDIVRVRVGELTLENGVA